MQKKDCGPSSQDYDASTLAMSLKAKSAKVLQAFVQQLNQQGFSGGTLKLLNSVWCNWLENKIMKAFNNKLQK